MALRLQNLWNYLTGLEWVMVLLLIGLVAFSTALIVLIGTRWGHFRPIRKCILLSLLAHLLLAGYATTVRIVSLVPPSPEPVLHIAFIEGPSGEGDGAAANGSLTGDDRVPPPPSKEPATKLVEPPTPEAAPPVKPAPAPPPPKPVQEKKPDVPPPTSNPAANDGSDWMEAEMAGEYADDMDIDPPAAEPKAAVPTKPQTQVASRAVPAREAKPEGGDRAVPEAYKLRVTGDHLSAVRRGGGSPETEAAVHAGLDWLAHDQSEDGHWDAAAHEAGRDTQPDGQSRPGAGLKADTAMTGLSLLTLLASGDSHLRGDRQDTIRRGLEYLLRTQHPDGRLSGDADVYAAMYCHAIATFALSEAYGMTSDRRLEAAVRRAVNYTLNAQDPVGGGWRYFPHQAGDTSQLGWQFMALKSAELAGIAIPDATRQGIIRYLQSVAGGEHGGIARYQPLKPPSPTMTAEAIMCWQFLGMSREHPASNEAGTYLTSTLPEAEHTDFYYWYYGTLATYQLGGEHWRRWNAALQANLLRRQEKSGPHAGSWNPDSVWGGYGGRIYSTSLATLCLEVYYRYLPLYVHAEAK